MGTAVLTLNQINEFQTNGQQLPTYAIQPNKTLNTSSQNWKLFPTEITDENRLYLYKRCDIATNAVDITPNYVWGKGWKITLYNKNGKQNTDGNIQKQIVDLTRKHNIAAAYEEAHRYARLFGLGIVVFGLADDKELSEPTEKASALNYVTAFSKDEIQKLNYNTDPNSVSYGKIESYEIKLPGEGNQTFKIHSSRVAHVNEKTIKKNPWGVSVLDSPYDLFFILKNTDWSAGEAYYQNASPLYVLSWDDTQTNIDPPTPTEKDAAKSDLEDIHVKKRYIKPKSWDLTTVNGSGKIADPNMIWSPIIERIAGSVDIPKQLLLGTSAGALASGETNLQQWFTKIANKQTSWAEPLLNDFYSRLTQWGIIPEVTIQIEWPTLYEMDEKEQAEIQKLKIESAVAATATTVNLNGTQNQPLMAVDEARKLILGLNPTVGGGEQQNFQTNQPADFSTLVNELNKIKQETQEKTLTREEATAKAKIAIKKYVEKRATDALSYLSNKTRHPLKTLSPEQQQQQEQQKQNLLTYFTKILDDAADE